MTSASKTELVGAQRVHREWRTYLTVGVVSGALVYFCAMWFGLPFNAHLTFVLNQSAIVAASMLIVFSGTRKWQRILAVTALPILLIWSFADFASPVARMPGDIRAAAMQATAACEEARRGEGERSP
jgi:hypothetical protein